jgi:chemotaxis protein histidine kinase CheA
MSRIPANLQEKWVFIGSKRFADQCKWMLNGFWDKMESEAENVWQWCQSFVKFDKECQISEKKGEASDLDEFWSHKFLESLGQTMTVIEMRDCFRQIDADFNKRMSIVEYLMFRYKLKVVDVVNASQGDNTAEVQKAQAMVEAGQRAVDEMNVKLEASRSAAVKAQAALEEAKRKAASSKQSAEEAKKAAEAAWFAEQENKKALEELQKQEKAFQDKKSELEKAKEDSSLGLVKRNQASAQLAQLLAEDPLPLRKAKINQSATVKKSEKARAAADQAKAKADAEAEAAAKAALASEAAAKDAQAAAVAAEGAVKQAEALLQEALDFLEAAKKKGGIAHGDIWWMQREITEKKKYLPSSKQK